MDFDNPKVYGDTPIADGLVLFQNRLGYTCVHIDEGERIDILSASIDLPRKMFKDLRM